MRLSNRHTCFKEAISEWREFEDKVMNKLHFYLDKKIDLPETFENINPEDYELEENKKERELLYIFDNKTKNGLKTLSLQVPVKYKELLNSGKCNKEELLYSVVDDLTWIDGFTYDLLDKYERFESLIKVDEGTMEVELEDIREASNILVDYKNANKVSELHWKQSIEEIYKGFKMVFDLLNEVEKAYYSMRN
ncbi:MAG: hypothetical protein ABEK17_01555 [Candidatus Aenigmatarchaeota archaeon]